MKILHLVDPDSHGGGACTLRWLAEVAQRLREFHHDVLVIGTAADAALARECGVESIGSVARRGRISANVGAVIRAHERSRGEYDIVHSWSPRAAMIACDANASRSRLRFRSNGSLSEKRERRHFATVVEGPTHYSDVCALDSPEMRTLAAFERVRSNCLKCGLLRSRTTALPPPVDPSAIAANREEVRSRWEVDEETFVVGFLIEPADQADANVAKTLAARLVLAGKRVKAVVHSTARRRIEAETAARTIGFEENLLIVDDAIAMPWIVAAGLDAAASVGSIASPGEAREPVNMLPVLWAMAAALPVVVESSAIAAEVIDDERSGFLMERGDVNAACERIGRCIDDRELARTIGEAAAQHVRERHDPAASCEQLQQVYTKASGTRDEAPGRRVPCA